MVISDVLKEKQSFSFEIFPPKGDMSLEEARKVATELVELKPDWISVTFSAGGSGNSGTTADIAGMVEAMPNETQALMHLTCMGATTVDIDGHLAAMRARGVNDVLALRGDPAPGREPRDFAFAADLIAYIRKAAPDFCIGAACYPEGHVACDSLARSMEHLYLKQEAGADYFVTQLFFDNEDFYRFRELCLRYRIKVPIIAGIMPFTSVKQIQRMAFTCGASIPARVIRRLAAAGDSPEAQVEAGLEYACEQLCDLAANGVDGLHIYTMNKPEVARATHAALAECGYLGV